LTSFIQTAKRCRSESSTCQTHSQNETRTADAVVGFDRPHPRFGDGIVVEVQDKHKEKDVLETTRAYLTNGYSVCWLSVDDFGKYSLKYSQAEFEKLVRNEFPDADSVFEAELNPDGTVPRNEMYPLVAAACPHSIAVKRDDSRGYGMYEEWFTGMIRHPDFRRRFLQGAEGIEFSSHRNYTITLPREWYEERARQYFRETPWQDFFESYTWDTDEVQEEWGELAAIDEMEVKIPLSKWLADDGKVLVVGEETNHPRYNHQTRGDFIPDTSELVGWEGLPDDKLAAFIPDSDLQNAETESDSAMVLRDGRDYERVNNLEFYVPARTLWNVTPWESRFSDGLELPIAPDVDGEETTPTAQIPFGYWITSGDVPDTIKNELMRAHHRGRRNMPKSEKDKAEAKERVPRIIRHNTGDPQPDTIAKHHVLTITSHANISPDAVRWALPRLVQSGEIEEPEPERYRLPAE